MENSYSAKISIRSGGKYCVKFPKKLIESKEFSLGDVVEVSIKKQR